MENSENNHQDNPGVITFPPLIYAGAALLGAGLHRLKPWRFPLSRRAAFIIGGGMVAVAGLAIGSAMWALRTARTNVHPDHSTNAIVSKGIFQYSRNPMYLAFLFLFLSTGFFLNTVWMLILTFPLVRVVEEGVIKREERYLIDKFGEEYTQYKNSVRRWI